MRAWGGGQWESVRTSLHEVAQLRIEVGDGFSPYGFSLEDLAANRKLRQEQLELYRFQADEIDTAELDAGEYRELQARASVLEPFAGKSVYAHHGQRVVNGCRLMQSASDLFLGWIGYAETRGYVEKVLIDRQIYGQFLEHINHSVVDGLFAEQIRGAGFEGRDFETYWTTFGPPNAVRVVDSQFERGSKSVRIAAGGQRTGIRQRRVFLESGRSYDGSVWIRIESGAPRVSLRVLAADGSVVVDLPFRTRGSEWQEVPYSFASVRTDRDAGIEIAATGRGAALVDFVSLMRADVRRGGMLRPDLLSALPLDDRTELLAHLPREEADRVRHILGTHEAKAGSLVSAEFVALPKHTTAGDALRLLRERAPAPDSLSYIYVVTDPGEVLLGVVDLRELVLARETATLEELMISPAVSADAELGEQDVAELFEKYGWRMLPVVDSGDRLLGVIGYKDIRR